ncbi:34893_t:CDS:1, partial [Racocetra persica]
AKKAYKNSDIEYLKIQDITNIKVKLIGSMNSHLVDNSNIKVDIIET